MLTIYTHTLLHCIRSVYMMEIPQNIISYETVLRDLNVEVGLIINLVGIFGQKYKY